MMRFYLNGIMIATVHLGLHMLGFHHPPLNTFTVVALIRECFLLSFTNGCTFNTFCSVIIVKKQTFFYEIHGLRNRLCKMKLPVVFFPNSPSVSGIQAHNGGVLFTNILSLE